MDRVALSEPQRMAEVGGCLLVLYVPSFPVFTVILFIKLVAHEFAYSFDLCAACVSVASIAVLESKFNNISILDVEIHATLCCPSVVVLAKTTDIENIVVANVLSRTLH